MAHTEAPVSFTTKINGDLLTLRAETVEGFVAIADAAATNPGFAIAIGLIQNLTTDPATAQAVSTLGGTVIEAEPFAPPTNQWAPSTPTQPAWTPPAQQAAPAGNAPACDHGQPMKLIPAGVSKSTGNPFRAFYACAAPREVQCKKRISV